MIIRNLFKISGVYENRLTLILINRKQVNLIDPEKISRSTKT